MNIIFLINFNQKNDAFFRFSHNRQLRFERKSRDLTWKSKVPSPKNTSSVSGGGGGREIAGEVAGGRLGRSGMVFLFRSIIFQIVATNKTNCKNSASSLQFNFKIPLNLKLEWWKREKSAIWNISVLLHFHDGLVLDGMLYFKVALSTFSGVVWVEPHLIKII